MSETSKLGGRGVVLCSALAAASVAAACGDSFGSEDCMVTRTCMATGGSSAGDDGKGNGNESGEATGGTTYGGAGGEAGGEPIAACVIAADCSNDDPTDGAEACEAGQCVAGNPPPRVVSITPSADDDAAEPDATIVIEFSEPLDPSTVDADSVKVSSGEEVVLGTLTYAGLKATFVPEAPLRLHGDYAVTVTTAVTDEASTPMLDDFSSEFSVRDGVWKAISPLIGDFYSVGSTMPIAPSGAVLLTWSGASAKNCPTSAGWLDLGASSLEPKAFSDVTTNTSCSSLLSAANDSATSVVTWSQDGSYAQQLRAGRWLAKSAQLYANSQTYPTGLAVAKDGKVSRFDAKDEGGLTVTQTDVDGVWAPKPTVLTANAAWSAPSIAFDAAGNGLAAWVSVVLSNGRARIAWSRYTAETGQWSPAADLPGSIPAVDDTRRGAPTVALAPSGEGVVVWRDGEVDGKLMANHFTLDNGWSSEESVSGGIVVPYVFDAAGLVFDGTSFVAAWRASGGGVDQVYTAHRLASGGWSTPEPHDAKKPLPYSQMPLLASDGHGTVELVWKTGSAPNYALYHHRFTAEAWGTIEAVPGGTITDPQNQGAQKPALAMNASGVVAIGWANHDDSERLKEIRLARFY